jgi:hypothetical protein
MMVSISISVIEVSSLLAVLNREADHRSISDALLSLRHQQIASMPG